MIRLRLRLRRFSRLALGLLLALSIVPSVSQMLASGAPAGPWAELCGSLGSPRLVALDQGPSDTGPAPAAQPEHCPLCGSAAALLPPPPVQEVPDGVFVSKHPPLFAQAPRPLFAWLAARPRGPPRPA